MNHSTLAVLKSQRETLSHRLNQWMRSACSAQNPSGSEASGRRGRDSGPSIRSAPSRQTRAGRGRGALLASRPWAAPFAGEVYFSRLRARSDRGPLEASGGEGAQVGRGALDQLDDQLGGSGGEQDAVAVVAGGDHHAGEGPAEERQAVAGSRSEASPVLGGLQRGELGQETGGDLPQPGQALGGGAPVEPLVLHSRADQDPARARHRIPAAPEDDAGRRGSV